uniref:helicase associated domain-containing protein n=1 Tax=Streptomyces canus TaxID=58343 RepID=UPI000490BED8
GVLPAVPGEVVVQGEDLTVWVTAQRAGWDGLVTAQRYLLESLGVEPLGEHETAVPARRTQADRWATHLAAARQFHTREGHLRVPRSHVEELAGEDGDRSTAVRLGRWLDNTRRRADKLAAERRAELDELGMRW